MKKGEKIFSYLIILLSLAFWQVPFLSFQSMN